MHVWLSASECEQFLRDELQRTFPSGQHAFCGPHLLVSEMDLPRDRMPPVVFARQLLPEARREKAPSISAWAQRVLDAVVAVFPPGQPWHLQVAPHYGLKHAGHNRCQLIRAGMEERLQRQHRSWRRCLDPDLAPFSPRHSAAQLLLLSPDEGFLSLSPSPMPFQLRPVLSPFAQGEIPIASDKAAPSRAFAKLLEAEQRLGCRIAQDDACVDLGAAPGSWSYVALQRGARVVAVDRAPLRADLMRHSRLRFVQGDAFSYQPERPVDWLLCDVIAAPARSVEVLREWIQKRWTRRFVVTIKFKGGENYDAVDPLKETLATNCSEYYLTRLCANKNEFCAFGIVAPPGGPASPGGAGEKKLC